MTEQFTRGADLAPHSERATEHKPIIYVVSNGKGLGHSSRAVSVAREIGCQAPIVFFTHSDPQRAFMGDNLLQTPAVNYKFENYHFTASARTWHEQTDTDRQSVIDNNASLTRHIASGGALITDLVAQTPFIVDRLRTVNLTDIQMMGILHSLEHTNVAENGDGKRWRDNSLEIASSFDVLFHIGLFGSDYSLADDIPGSKTKVEFCGPIVKPVTRSPKAVKEELGLHPDDQFVLIKGGMNGNDDLKTLVQNAASEPSDINYVVQGWCMDLPNMEFPNNVIFAPARPDGQNYVNAAEMVISKPGFQTSSECVATQTPLLYLPYPYKPEGTANIELLSRFLDGMPIEIDFTRDIDRQVRAFHQHLPDIRERFAEVTCNGAQVIANYLVKERGKSLQTPPPHETVLFQQ